MRASPSIELLRELFVYEDWANREALASLRRAAAPPAVAVRRLAHIGAAQLLWSARIERAPAPIAVWPELDLAATAELILGVSSLWTARLTGPAALDPAAGCQYANSKGERFDSRVGDILLHVLAHGAHHRGQIAADLRTAGADPAYTDFIHWVRTHSGAGPEVTP